MRVHVIGKALAGGEVNPRGYADLPVDTSGRGDVVKLVVWPDNETSRLPEEGLALLKVKAGDPVDVVCDVYVTKRGGVGLRPVSV